MWKFPKSDFLSDAFLFASDGLKSGSVRETGWLSRQQATEDAVNITRICAESLMKNQS